MCFVANCMVQFTPQRQEHSRLEGGGDYYSPKKPLKPTPKKLLDVLTPQLGVD